MLVQVGKAKEIPQNWKCKFCHSTNKIDGNASICFHCKIDSFDDSILQDVPEPSETTATWKCERCDYINNENISNI